MLPCSYKSAAIVAIHTKIIQHFRLERYLCPRDLVLNALSKKGNDYPARAVLFLYGESVPVFLAQFVEYGLVGGHRELSVGDFTVGVERRVAEGRG